MFTNLLAPSLAGVNHLLERLGVLLGAVIALENVRCVHICVVFINPLQRCKISIKREQKKENYLLSVRNLSNFFVIYCSIAPTFLIILRERRAKKHRLAIPARLIEHGHEAHEGANEKRSQDDDFLDDLQACTFTKMHHIAQVKNFFISLIVLKSRAASANMFA